MLVACSACAWQSLLDVCIFLFFRGLDSLEHLSVSDNALADLSPDLFDEMPNLYTLWIYNNKISHLPAGIFGNLPKLCWVDLRDNNLVTLSQDILSLDTPRYYYYNGFNLKLSGNAISCDDDVCWLYANRGWVNWWGGDSEAPQCSDNYSWSAMNLRCEEKGILKSLVRFVFL